MIDLFKPILACEADLTKLKFPLLASAKLDGVRAVVRDGVVYSRSNKPIPNVLVQNLLDTYEHFDGELIVGEPTSKTCYRDTLSHVMSSDKTNYDLRFYVFDHIKNLTDRYQNRLVTLNRSSFNPNDVFVHQQHVVTCLQTLLELEETMLGLGYEGLILRDPDAPYKRGRSTMKEGYLLKLKRMVTSEAVIIGFEERMHNGNVAETNELGRTKRSSHQENKTGRGDLGALIGRDTVTGVEFNTGTGFSDDERAEIWNNKPKYLGRMFSYDHFPIGAKDKPRHPSYKGLRDSRDL